VTVDERVRPALPPTTIDADTPASAPAGAPAPDSTAPDSRSTTAGQIDPSDPTAPAFDEAGDPLPASTFAPEIDDAALGFSSSVHAPRGCEWCGAPLSEPDPAVCPSCGAALRPVADLPEIPGVTVAPADVRRIVRDVSPEIRALVTPPVTDEIARPGARPELGPPDGAVRRAMLELELEALRVARLQEARAEAARAAVEWAAAGGRATGPLVEGASQVGPAARGRSVEDGTAATSAASSAGGISAEEPATDGTASSAASAVLPVPPATDAPLPATDTSLGEPPAP
jgi:hypothetical protein